MSGVSSTIQPFFNKLIVIVVLSQLAFVGLPDEAYPTGFSLVATDVGTALYQRHSPYGTFDYVQVIHLDQGAAVQLLHGPIADNGRGEGVYGGDNPLLYTQPLSDVWVNFSQTNISPNQPQAFCLTNGQFYSSHTSTVRLSFPLKIDGNIVSDGFAIDQFPYHQLMLEIWPHRADIAPLSADALLNSSAPNILGGLTEYAGGRRPNRITGRTFVGVGQPRLDGSYSTIYIFNSRLARKTEAAATLRSFGAEKVMMLDGGASTQLICQGENYVGPGRLIPQTIAVLAGPPSPWLYIFDYPEVFLSCELRPLWHRTADQPDGRSNFWC
jgi:hypothetical protein